MGRVYKKKTNRVDVTEEIMSLGIRKVIKGELSIRRAALQYGINKSTLFKRVKMAKSINPDLCIVQNRDDSGQSSQDEDVVSLKNLDRKKYKHRQVFSDFEEEQLKQYLLKASKINYGLTYAQTRKLAFEFAEALGKPIEKVWKNYSAAGVDWKKGFMTRHKELSLRKPENTSLARATAFNRTNVTEFHDNLKDVVERYKFSHARIYNIDETGITTVMNAPKVYLLLILLYVPLK